MVLYLAADLLWGMRIKATAELLGVPARPVRSVEMLEDRLGDGEPLLLLLDLEALDTALAMIARLRGPGANERDRAIRIIAWGPHSSTDAIEQARAAGADEVLARGAFDRRLAGILLASCQRIRPNDPDYRGEQDISGRV
jgi:hypothetical protein